jgi:hypothetical protein
MPARPDHREPAPEGQSGASPPPLSEQMPFRPFTYGTMFDFIAFFAISYMPFSAFQKNGRFRVQR